MTSLITPRDAFSVTGEEWDRCADQHPSLITQARELSELQGAVAADRKSFEEALRDFQAESGLRCSDVAALDLAVNLAFAQEGRK